MTGYIPLTRINSPLPNFLHSKYVLKQMFFINFMCEKLYYVFLRFNIFDLTKKYENIWKNLPLHLLTAWFLWQSLHLGGGCSPLPYAGEPYGGRPS